jgi:ribonucleotide reductase alpha subunit
MMGTDYIYERGGAALNNCGFISTKDIDRDFAKPFTWMFGMSMLGVGVGFDTKGKGKVEIQRPKRNDERFFIGDSREGWADALSMLLNAYVGEGELPGEWDYSEIRPKGAPIRSFGGVASGPDPLQKMLETLEALYDSYIGKEVDAQLIVDTMNITGRCVVSGGVRRTAQIAFGQKDDKQFLDLKMDQEKVSEWRWASNNSIQAEVGMDYSEVATRTGKNGEPGYLWLENARAFGRMKDEPNWKDEHAEGSNPCVEQTLWDKELCCLVETYPNHHDDIEDYKETLRVAYQYAKTVTLIPTHDAGTNAVMLRNRRIGCSMTGIVQALNKHGYREFFDWCDEGYDYIQHLDKKYSDWLCIPRSIKTTSVKPSGTVSLLAGATPGVHWDHSPHYIRRVRVQEGHELIDMCRNAGYHVEEDHYSDNTMVIEFPVKVDSMDRRKNEVSLREKVDLAARIQHYWADNQVSCTAEFDPDTEADDIPRILAAYEDRLKGISFLPMRDHGYQQAPYEEISEQEYEEMRRDIKPLQAQNGSRLQHDQEDKFCDGEACTIE